VLALGLAGEAHAQKIDRASDDLPVLWQESRKLVSPSDAPGDEAGRGVSISGDIAVVGAPVENGFQGAAYIFARNQGGMGHWGQVKRLIGSQVVSDSYFGFTVSISGSTIVVGSHGENASRGAAYVFERNQGGANNWGEVARLTASDRAAGDQFGTWLSLDVDTVVLGALIDDDLGDRSGSAYIFGRNQGGPNHWGQVKKLLASDGAAGDVFGILVSLSGDIAVVGAGADDDACPLDPNCDSGSAYLFERNHGGAENWGQIKKLTALDASAGDGFGFEASISGDTLVVGSYSDDDACPADPNCDSGSAYVFGKNHGGTNNWGQIKKLTPSDMAAGDGFGRSVWMEGENLLIGAVGVASGRGAAYTFERNRGGADNWGEAAKLVASDGFADDLLGVFVCISGQTALLGAVGDDSFAGSAYVFLKLSIFSDDFESGNLSAWSGMLRGR